MAYKHVHLLLIYWQHLLEDLMGDTCPESRPGGCHSAHPRPAYMPLRQACQVAPVTIVALYRCGQQRRCY